MEWRCKCKSLNGTRGCGVKEPTLDAWISDVLSDRKRVSEWGQLTTVRYWIMVCDQLRKEMSAVWARYAVPDPFVCAFYKAM